MLVKCSAGTGFILPLQRKESNSWANIWVLSFSYPVGISEHVLPKTFKSSPKKPGEDDGREERRGYGQVW